MRSWRANSAARSRPCSTNAEPASTRRDHQSLFPSWALTAPNAGVNYVFEDEREARNIAVSANNCSVNRAFARNVCNVGRVGTPHRGRGIQGIEPDCQGRCGRLHRGVERFASKALHRGSGQHHPQSCGPVSESDILLASASSAIIIGFQVRPVAQRVDWLRRKAYRSSCTR